MIRALRIKNYKSILDLEIELGRLNIFIGENGAGKTNILEALGFAAAALIGQCTSEELFNRGIRVARPRMTLSSFRGVRQAGAVEIQLSSTGESESTLVKIYPETLDQADAAWTFLQPSTTLRATPAMAGFLRGFLDRLPVELLGDPLAAAPENLDHAADVLSSGGKAAIMGFLAQVKFELRSANYLVDLSIYNPNILALRGLQITSHKEPLGIYGENLDIALAALAEPTLKDLLERARCINWLDTFEIDASDQLKFQGHKLGRSRSTLYFRDRFMQQKNNLFSSENANEGILHILFYLVLFAHPKTPRIFGIDNIETALNPQLCRDLVVQLAALAKVHDKQALITTHNPAILDGLDLNDDDQRLFVVSRDDDGHTVAERIRQKPAAEGARYKLSEMWMRGLLGGLPQRF